MDRIPGGVTFIERRRRRFDALLRCGCAQNMSDSNKYIMIRKRGLI